MPDKGHSPRHPVSVPRCGRLDSPGKILNFKKFSGVRPSSKFFTGEIKNPAWDNMKILLGEPIYIYICFEGLEETEV